MFLLSNQACALQHTHKTEALLLLHFIYYSFSRAVKNQNYKTRHLRVINAMIDVHKDAFLFDSFLVKEQLAMEINDHARLILFSETSSQQRT